MLKNLKQSILTLVVAAACVFLAGSVALATPHLGIRARAFPGGGVKVVDVEAGSVADDLGLETGDVILTINGQLVNLGSEAADAIANSGGHVSLVLRHEGAFLQVDADLEEPMQTFAAPFDPKSGKAGKAPAAKMRARHVTRKQLKR